jgi:hypothetical protein
MIEVTDVLTNKRWNMPNSFGAAPVYLGQFFPPGRYDIKNGSGANLVVVTGNNVQATIPNGATWNIATNENDRSWSTYCPDYAVWMHSGRFN